MSNQDELVLYLYENIEMGVNSTHSLIKLLKNKDNKIKPFLDSLINDYEKYFKDVKKIRKKYKVKKKNKKIFINFMASISMKMDISMDNSDSKVANILVRGFNMGIIDLEKRINEYNNLLKKNEKSDILSLACDVYKFSENSINVLKEYL